jgi:hypothetical protein
MGLDHLGIRLGSLQFFFGLLGVAVRMYKEPAEGAQHCWAPAQPVQPQPSWYFWVGGTGCRIEMAAASLIRLDHLLELFWRRRTALTGTPGRLLRAA